MKTTFDRLKELFQCDWTTVFVGWRGLGIYSPWRSSQMEFPPLLSEFEILGECESAIINLQDDVQLNQIVSIIDDITSSTWTRESVLNMLDRLAIRGSENEEYELRKWRLVLLENLLEKYRQISAVDFMYEIGEFWLSFGFPQDVPKRIQEGYLSACDFTTISEGDVRNYFEFCKQWIGEEVLLIQQCLPSSAKL